MTTPWSSHLISSSPPGESVSDRGGELAVQQSPVAVKGSQRVWAPVLGASGACRRGRKTLFFFCWVWGFYFSSFPPACWLAPSDEWLKRS